MHTNEEMPRGRRRRRHSDEFKAEAVEACGPGVSMAAVALAYGINANLLRRWVVLRRGSLPTAADSAQPTFVPLALPAPSSEPPGDIHIDIKRGATTITLRWPAASAQSCAAWLRELLR